MLAIVEEVHKWFDFGHKLWYVFLAFSLVLFITLPLIALSHSHQIRWTSAYSTLAATILLVDSLSHSSSTSSLPHSSVRSLLSIPQTTPHAQECHRLMSLLLRIPIPPQHSVDRQYLIDVVETVSRATGSNGTLETELIRVLVDGFDEDLGRTHSHTSGDSEGLSDSRGAIHGAETAGAGVGSEPFGGESVAWSQEEYDNFFRGLGFLPGVGEAGELVHDVMSW
ncbi:hypothetical protein P7C70_g5597, partial [Phenoliferia sp. Uapishka_3]